MKCILFVAGRRLQSLRIWACRGWIVVEEGGDHEGEVGADLVELGWLEFECEQLRLDKGRALPTTLVSIEDTWHSN